MLASLVPFCLVVAILLHKWRRWKAQGWVKQQRDIARFRFAANPDLPTRLHLRASENRRLKAAFGIDNSLTTETPENHEAFLKMAIHVLNRGTRSWEELYNIAESFLQGEFYLATQDRQSIIPLAESVRCMVLAVVLFDSFGVDPEAVERSDLVTITEEINNQWLKSKCDPDAVAPSDLLNSTIASLNLASPTMRTMTPVEALGLLMPQYETLWRVVLLTFVTAYHHQPAAYPDTVERAASVPSCLGDPSREAEALKLAQEGLRLYPSNKHLYRAAAVGPQSPTLAADISALHRHPAIWNPPPSPPTTHSTPALTTVTPSNPPDTTCNALTFHPPRFTTLTPLQRRAYIPFSLGWHKCPAASNKFGERMVVVLVVALGRMLGPERGRVLFGEDNEHDNDRGGGGGGGGGGWGGRGGGRAEDGAG
ncbi:hypothetical protein C8A05DRAFT_15807 [Staphylotrichum tortipilum]|uniref:Cytochrome P450 n=1 Tax=Staphylotrichum tortipilum TaxID=2831512 RepID=A0AAN6MLJ5_9PEZI|nr:hypothetical protein C8A05DRAFT_15807 [Staphylotrichum longicolle]